MKISKDLTTEKGFFVGDPCYVFEDASWQEVLTGFYKNEEAPTVEVNGKSLGMVNTAYGDGVYTGSDAIDYSVDSGSLGVVPLELLEVPEDGLNNLGFIQHGKSRAIVTEENGKVTVSIRGEGKDTTIEIGTDGTFEDDDIDLPHRC